MFRLMQAKFGIKQASRYFTQASMSVVGLFLTLVYFSVLFSGASLSLHNRWVQFDGAYSHGYLLVAVCLLKIIQMVFLSFERQEAKPNYALTLLSIAPALIWSFGYTTQINAFQQMALYLVLPCILISLLGARSFFGVLFIVVILSLALPIWEALQPILRTMTTVVSIQGVRLLDIPAYIDEYSFTLPYGTVIIAGSCAGLSFFLMGAVLSSINAISRNFSLLNSILTILLMCFLAIIGNWIRVYLLILIAYYSKMEHPLVQSHGSFGWVIFAVIFILYLWLIRNIPEGNSKFLEAPVANDKVDFKKTMIVCLLVVGITSALPIWILNFENKSAVTVLQVEAEDMHFVSDASADVTYRPLFTGYDSKGLWQTNLLGGTWLVGRLVYEKQDQNSELISDSNRISDVEFIKIEKDIKLSDRQFFKATVIQGRKHRLVLSAYMIGNKSEIDDIAGKLTQFTEALSGRTGVALFYATIECTVYNCELEIEGVKNHPMVVLHWLQSLKIYD